MKHGTQSTVNVWLLVAPHPVRRRGVSTVLSSQQAFKTASQNFHRDGAARNTVSIILISKLRLKEIKYLGQLFLFIFLKNSIYLCIYFGRYFSKTYFLNKQILPMVSPAKMLYWNFCFSPHSVSLVSSSKYHFQNPNIVWCKVQLQATIT